MYFDLCKDIQLIILKYTHYCLKCRTKFAMCFWCTRYKCWCDTYFQQTYICAICTFILEDDIQIDFALEHPSE